MEALNKSLKTEKCDKEKWSARRLVRFCGIRYFGCHGTFRLAQGFPPSGIIASIAFHFVLSAAHNRVAGRQPSLAASGSGPPQRVISL
jgi:hypothetical protein